MCDHDSLGKEASEGTYGEGDNTGENLTAEVTGEHGVEDVEEGQGEGDKPEGASSPMRGLRLSRSARSSASNWGCRAA